MKLGFFVTNQYLPGESMSEKIEESSEQVRAARDVGFSLIATGQHYLAAPYQMSTSLTLLARLAADAGDMQVAATVILVPLHNPVELAESIVQSKNSKLEKVIELVILESIRALSKSAS